MTFFEWLLGKATTSAPSRNLESIHLAPGRAFDFEIVGESHRQDVLDDLCGGKCDEGHDLPVTAQLCFIDDNPYDPNAVGVFVNRQLVGYIPRQLAPTLRSDIIRLNPDGRSVVCDGKVVGGWDRGDGDEGHYGVKLSISHPLRLRP